MTQKNGRLHLQWCRLIGLLLSCLGLCANTLWAQRIVVLDPPDLNPDAVCGFDIRNKILLCVEDANDTCMWSADEGIGQFGDHSAQTGNKNADTIYFYLNQNPKSGDLKVKMGTGEGKLALTMIPRAVTVKDITWDPPICQNEEVEFRIPIDEDYETKYLPGSLHLRWTLLWDGLDEMDGDPTFVNVTTDDDFNWHQKIRGADFKDGKVVVRPYTCDGPTGKQYRTAEKSADLTPFIVRGLYTGKHIHRLKKRDKEAGEEEGDVPTDNWELDGTETEPNKTICRDYSTDQPGWNEAYGKEGYVYLGFAKEEYEEWLVAGSDEKRKLLPEYYYSYQWTIDPEEFEFATSKMNGFPIDDGFGVNKSRVALRVLEGKNHGVETKHSVTLTVKCETCIERGGAEADFTYTTTIDLERQDSILDFASFPIEYAVHVEDEVCAESTTVVEINMDEQSSGNFPLSNATQYN
ncbi:MAG: hypothetical protein K2O46_08175, partial [Bacteroidales bacterium]|nr:hypothetical protein [Bacteroidales bacterium]